MNGCMLQRLGPLCNLRNQIGEIYVFSNSSCFLFSLFWTKTFFIQNLGPLIFKGWPLSFYAQIFSPYSNAPALQLKVISFQTPKLVETKKKRRELICRGTICPRVWMWRGRLRLSAAYWHYWQGDTSISQSRAAHQPSRDSSHYCRVKWILVHNDF